jgi:hypothetical protein
LHYDGTPITARFIAHAIRESVARVAPAALNKSLHKELA